MLLVFCFYRCTVVTFFQMTEQDGSIENIFKQCLPSKTSQNMQNSEFMQNDQTNRRDHNLQNVQNLQNLGYAFHLDQKT